MVHIDDLKVVDPCPEIHWSLAVLNAVTTIFDL